MRHSVLLDSEIKGQARDQGPQPCLILSSSTQLLIPTASDLINFDQFRTFLPLLNSPRCLPHHSFALAHVAGIAFGNTLLNLELGGHVLDHAHHMVGTMKEEGLALRARQKLLLRASSFTICWMRFGKFCRQQFPESFRQKFLPGGRERTRSVSNRTKVFTHIVGNSPRVA